MAKKIRVGILFGGRSAEHEVSLQSAKNVVEALDKEKFEAVLIGIDKQGHWHLAENSKFLLHAENPKLVALNQSNKEVSLRLGRSENQLTVVDQHAPLAQVDVVFPILHGPLGEDGTVQGMLRLANLPFVGSGVLGSAVCMDKDMTKRLLKHAGVPTCRYVVLKKNGSLFVSYAKIAETFGEVLFVKPANLGSSVGVSKVRNEAEFQVAIALAFRHDQKVLVEEAVPGRELEVAVLGGDQPLASVVGEIIPQADFYSYDAKYIDAQGAVLKIPAEVSGEISDRARRLAIESFQTLECAGLARVDFFLKASGELLVNEINTIPGFTKISMYPKLWEASGISYSDLISRLIALAFEAHARQQSLE